MLMLWSTLRDKSAPLIIFKRKHIYDKWVAPEVNSGGPKNKNPKKTFSVKTLRGKRSILLI